MEVAKNPWVKILLWLASVGAMIGLMMLGSNLLEEDNAGLLLEFAVITAVTLGFIWLISGKKTFTFLNNRTGYTVKSLLPILIFPAIFVVFGGIEAASSRPPLAESWLLNLLLFAANMFLVGIYEEGCFRACACDALLPALRKTKHPFLLTALISGAVFGYVHVVSADFSDLQQTLQFFLKIINTAVFGAAMMLLYWKTRNLLGLAIVHGLNDFLPAFLSEIFAFEEEEQSGAYTSGDVSTTVVYVIQLIFTAICFYAIYKKVAKTIDWKKTLEEW